MGFRNLFGTLGFHMEFWDLFGIRVFIRNPRIPYGVWKYIGILGFI